MRSWTLIGDTIYACQDAKDDAKIGVKSTALLFGDYVREILVCFATIFVASLVAAGKVNGHGPAYYVISCGVDVSLHGSGAV